MNIPGPAPRVTPARTDLGQYFPAAVLAFALSAACLFVVTAPAQTLRMVTYNVAADINGITAPRDGLYTVLEAIGQQSYAGVQQSIDLLALQETTSNTATVAPVVAALNDYYGAGTYALAGYQGTQRGGPASGNGPNALIYNQKTLALVPQNRADGAGVPGTPSSSAGAYRQVVRYQLQTLNGPASATFFVYVSHMKSSFSGTTAVVQTDRNTEAQLIAADIAALPAGTSALAFGDFNLDGSVEAAYQTLTNGGLLVDPLKVPQDNQQTWNKSFYRPILTDSSISLRHRDDIQFMTPNVYGSDPAAGAGLRYLPGSCRAFGNNGSVVLGGSANSALNTALATNFQGPVTAATALAALTTGSDHLPVVADYFVLTPLRRVAGETFHRRRVGYPR